MSKRNLLQKLTPAAIATLGAIAVTGITTTVGVIIPASDAYAIDVKQGRRAKFSKREKVQIVNGNPVYNTITTIKPDGTIEVKRTAKMVTRIDPVGDEIIGLGVHLTYDPSKVRVVTDLSDASVPQESAFGFYCEFSSNGGCPGIDDPFTLGEFGDPLTGSTFNLDIDNELGELKLSYDLSSTPVTVDNETNFFGFVWEPIHDEISSGEDDIFILPPEEWERQFVQNPESEDQFCVTTDTERIGLQCTVSTPEPSPTLSFLVLTTLSGISTLKRKLKPSETTEKNTTKVA